MNSDFIDDDAYREVPPASGYGSIGSMYPGFVPGYMPAISSPIQQTPSFATTPLIDTTPGIPFAQAPGAPAQLDMEYTQGYLKTQIGKKVRIDFLIGTNTFQDRQGTLEKVGISYVILKEAATGNLILCDIYSIKFVTIFS